MTRKNQTTSSTAKCKTWFGCVRCLWKGFALLITLLVLVTMAYAAIRFLPEHTANFESMEEHFKYGSTGGDRLTGIPFWMWQAMPLVCADTLNEIAGDRLAPDYKQRVQQYQSGEEAEVKRRALSREGFKALGFLYENDSEGNERDLPIGMSNRHSLGLDRVYLNCAICHTSTVRKTPQSQSEIVIGMPANTFNLYNFEHFMFQCAKSAGKTRLPMFDYLPQIESLGGDLDLLDHYLVYPVAIWVIRDVMMFIENIAGFSIRQPEWGPGRNDTFTNNKIYLYGYPWRDILPDYKTTKKVHPEGIGIVDWPSIWLQGPRKVRADGQAMQLHWDGNNDRVEERNLNAALATSALPPVIDHESIECIEQWLETIEPPKYIFPIDQRLAEVGEPIYQDYCADCHGLDGRNFSGEKVGFVTHINQIKTDRYRLDNYTEKLALTMATTYAEQKREQREHDCPGGLDYVPPQRDKPDNMSDATPEGRLAAMSYEENTYRYKHYRKTYGYVNMPLDGIWLRAPYLHNGSVPNLRELLNPASQRSKVFYRGNDLYDPVNVGFAVDKASDAQGRHYFKYDTSIPGNHNIGHEGKAYGTLLPAADKDALVEYLKTF